MKFNLFKEIELPVPLFGIGCGVLGMSLAKVSVNFGKYASTLLKALEYRGYDSTGGVFQENPKKITILKLEELATTGNIPSEDFGKITTALTNFVFGKAVPFNLSAKSQAIFDKLSQEARFIDAGYRNYPLIYITGPEEQDINLTISQINTHKIRGGDTFVIAEENDKLLKNTMAEPHDDGYYGWHYVVLPQTGDTLMTTFSATIVLQLIALKMSVKKMKKLDKMGINEHGVHPDVPKNVSKSITVD